MSKYNVGDKVVVKKSIECGEKYGMDGESNKECMVTRDMATKAGTVVTISNVKNCGGYSRYYIEEDNYNWVDGMFEGLVEEKKVFTANDLKTGMFGVLSTGDKFVVVNDHLVYQDDGYDHIRTMFDNDDSYAYIDKVWEGIWSFRMLDRVLSGKATYGTLVYDYERDTKKYYNGKVVCVEKGYSESCPVSEFTIGKIYEIENGVIVSDTGYKSDAYCELGKLCGGMGWRFIPIVE